MYTKNANMYMLYASTTFVMGMGAKRNKWSPWSKMTEGKFHRGKKLSWNPEKAYGFHLLCPLKWVSDG